MLAISEALWLIVPSCSIEAAIVLSVVSEGMPLLYNGQEAGNTRRLPFFEKDSIEWQEHPQGALYKKLFALKKANTALWNGKWGARMIDVPNSVHNWVLSFVRQNEREKVFAVFNFSNEQQIVTFDQTLHNGRYTDYFSKESVEFLSDTRLPLKPWDYRIFIR